MFSPEHLNQRWAVAQSAPNRFAKRQASLKPHEREISVTTVNPDCDLLDQYYQANQVGQGGRKMKSEQGGISLMLAGILSCTMLGLMMFQPNTNNSNRPSGGGGCGKSHKQNSNLNSNQNRNQNSNQNSNANSATTTSPSPSATATSTP